MLDFRPAGPTTFASLLTFKVFCALAPRGSSLARWATTSLDLYPAMSAPACSMVSNWLPQTALTTPSWPHRMTLTPPA